MGNSISILENIYVSYSLPGVEQNLKHLILLCNISFVSAALVLKGIIKTLAAFALPSAVNRAGGAKRSRQTTGLQRGDLGVRFQQKSLY